MHPFDSKKIQYTKRDRLPSLFGPSGGLGGAFGYFYGIGNPLPIPECRPYQKSWQFSLLGKIGELGKILERFRK